MNKKVLRKLRKKVTNLAVVAAVLALIGAIGLLIVKGMSQTHVRNTYLNMTPQIVKTYIEPSAMTRMVQYVFIFWDVTRLCSFGMFVCGVFAAVIELFNRVRGKEYAFIMLAGSVCGLVSSIQLSIPNIIDLFYETINTSVINLACILTIVSSLFVIGAAALRSAGEKRALIPSQHPHQNPPQGYPQYSQNSTTPYVGPVDPNNLVHPDNNDTPKGY